MKIVLLLMLICLPINWVKFEKTVDKVLNQVYNNPKSKKLIEFQLKEKIYLNKMDSLIKAVNDWE